MIIVVGAGIIGMSCAVELAKRGAQVTVIDKNKVGLGCSYGNAGWMTPCFAMPLPMPGMLFKSMKWLANPEGPLYIKPQPSLLLMNWMTKFLFAMNEKQAQRAITALVDLSVVSLKEYERLNQAYPGKFGFDQKGLLMVSHTEAGVAAAVDEMERVADHNIRGKKLSSEEVLALEPSLKPGVVGGVYFPDEAHGEPLAIVQTLHEEAKRLGVTVLEETEMTDVKYSGNKISEIVTNKGNMKVDTLVLAAGSWSTAMSKMLKLSIPIMGGKGYAMIVPPLDKQPKIPMMLVEKKIAITPRDGSLRIAGTLELVDQDFSITERRVKSIQKGARQFLNVPENLEVKELWRGLRPCTPDGVPLIGFSSKVPNLMLATGHQMLGLQSGTGTGKLVAELVEGKKPWLDTTVFDPMRFT